MLQSTMLHELLTGKVYDQKTLADKLDLLELPYSVGEDLGMLIIRMEKHLSDMAHGDLALMEYAICNIISEVMHNHFHIWHTRDMHDYIVVLVSMKHSTTMSYSRSETPQTLLEQYAAQIQTNVQLYLKGAISISVSSWGKFPTKLENSMSERLCPCVNGWVRCKVCLSPLPMKRMPTLYIRSGRCISHQRH